MSDLILFVIMAVLCIATLAATLAYVVRTHAAAQTEWRAERERFVTALMSRNATEFAIAEARMHAEPVERVERNPYVEGPVGL